METIIKFIIKGKDKEGDYLNLFYKGSDDSVEVLKVYYGGSFGFFRHLVMSKKRDDVMESSKLEAVFEESKMMIAGVILWELINGKQIPKKIVFYWFFEKFIK